MDNQWLPFCTILLKLVIEAMAIIKEMEAEKAAEKARKKAEARAARRYFHHFPIQHISPIFINDFRCCN